MSKDPLLDPDLNNNTLRSLKDEKARMHGRPAVVTGEPVTDQDRIKKATKETAFLDPVPLI